MSFQNRFAFGVCSKVQRYTFGTVVTDLLKINKVVNINENAAKAFAIFTELK